MQATTWARLQLLAKEKGVATAAMLEGWCIKQLDAQGVPHVAPEDIEPANPKRGTNRGPKHTPAEDGIGGIFTF